MAKTNRLKSMLAMMMMQAKIKKAKNPEPENDNICLNCLKPRDEDEKGVFCGDECKTEFRALEKVDQDYKLRKYEEARPKKK